MATLFADVGVFSALTHLMTSFFCVFIVVFPILVLIYGLMAFQLFIEREDSYDAGIEIVIEDELRMLNRARIAAGIHPIVYGRDHQNNEVIVHNIPLHVRQFLDFVTEPLPTDL